MKRIVGAAATLLLLASCQAVGTRDAPPDPANSAADAFDGADGSAAVDPLFVDLRDFSTNHLPRGSCLTESEIAAEQFIMLHTVLMVTGLTCNGAFRDPQLFGHYQTFTVNHQDRVRDAQQVLARFLGRYQRGNPNRLFDTYRTELANDESLLVLDLTPTNYCRAQYQRFYDLAELNEEGLQDYIDRAVDRYREHYLSCES